MKYTDYFCNFILTIAIFICAFYISWTLSSMNNFYYNQLYDRIEIGKHIKKYSIRNTNTDRRKFFFTDKNIHKQIFGEIVTAVNNNGKNLENINFKIKKQQIKFLTKSEISHLKDVAKLVNSMKYFVFIILILTILIIVLMKNRKVKYLGMLKNYIIFISFFSLIGILYYFSGFKKIFNLFHEICFKNGQWFFYYEDSLMTTLMKAPDIFFYISVILLILTIIFHFIAMLILNFYLKK